MSKCDCGENMIGHWILKCNARAIPKGIYDRLACWMADYEDPSLIQETMDAGDWKHKDVDAYLLEDALDIFNNLYHVYHGTPSYLWTSMKKRNTMNEKEEYDIGGEG